jgi:lipopolysaccharide transport system permease protein
MPYPLYALVGVTVWSAFTLFTLSAVNSISGGGNLVSKVYFPREVLVLSSLGNALINTLIRLAVVVVTFALFRYVPQPSVLLVPLVFLPMIALALGIGMLLAPINTMMNDMAKVMEFLFTFGMFITPAIYRTPDLGGGAWSDDVLYWVHTLNPVTHFIEAIRSLIDTGLITMSPGLLASTILSFLMLAIGWRFFHICEPLLAERL